MSQPKNSGMTPIREPKKKKKKKKGKDGNSSLKLRRGRAFVIVTSRCHRPRTLAFVHPEIHVRRELQGPAKAETRFQRRKWEKKDILWCPFFFLDDIAA
jgi:hypothetical protein